MMKNTKAFSLSKALPAAFQRLWEQNLEDRAAGRDYRGHTYYVTATDLERQVRAFACDSKAGRAWSTHWRDSYGTPFANSVGTNEVWVFTGGNLVKGTWTRADRLDTIAAATRRA